MADEKTDKPMQEAVVGRRAGATDDETIRDDAADIKEQVEMAKAVLEVQEEQIQKNLVKLNSIKLRSQGLANSFQQLIKLHKKYELESNKAYKLYHEDVNKYISTMRRHLVGMNVWAVAGSSGRVLEQALKMQKHYADFITELETHFLSRPM